jgi:hypothetical protein
MILESPLPLSSTPLPTPANVLCLYNSYFKKINVDPDSIWLGLCHESDQAKNYCRLFLETYTKNSLRKFLVLGPKEYEIRRALNSAASVTHCWRSLIAQADSTILSDKRQQDPKNKPLWRLKFVDHEKERGRGPIFEISKVSLIRSTATLLCSATPSTEYLFSNNTFLPPLVDI